jgi:hypothetical protein
VACPCPVGVSRFAVPLYKAAHDAVTCCTGDAGVFTFRAAGDTEQQHPLVDAPGVFTFRAAGDTEQQHPLVDAQFGTGPGSDDYLKVAHREDDHWTVPALGASHVGERSERALISTFVDRIAELSPELVTFNGSSFDLPVLRYRAMMHGVAAPGLSSRPYFNRYTEDAVHGSYVLNVSGAVDHPVWHQTSSTN